MKTILDHIPFERIIMACGRRNISISILMMRMIMHAIPTDMLIVSIKITIVIAYFHHSIFIAIFMLMLLRMMIRHSIETIAIIHCFFRSFYFFFSPKFIVAVVAI